MDNSVSQPVLSIRHLTKALARRRILSDISLDVYPGEIFGFLGPNGSGKTTTIKLMLGLLRIDTGDIRIAGYSVKDDFENAMEGIGGIIENPEMYKYLTGRENLEQYARMYDPPVTPERIDEVVELVGLRERIGDKISRYSLGMRQRLGVAQALLNHPKLLVLDEPTNGLDPAGIHDLRDILKKLAREENTAVFISSHLLAEMDMMCDRVGIVDRGTVVGVRTMDELRASSDAKADEERFLLGTANKTEAIRVLRENGAKVIPAAEENTLSVTAPKDGTYALLRALALADVEFHSVTPVRRSLEDAFLEMTRGTVGAGAAARTDSPADAATDAGVTAQTPSAADGKDGDVQ